MDSKSEIQKQSSSNQLDQTDWWTMAMPIQNEMIQNSFWQVNNQTAFPQNQQLQLAKQTIAQTG